MQIIRKSSKNKENHENVTSAKKAQALRAKINPIVVTLLVSLCLQVLMRRIRVVWARSCVIPHAFHPSTQYELGWSEFTRLLLSLRHRLNANPRTHERGRAKCLENGENNAKNNGAN